MTGLITQYVRNVFLRSFGLACICIFSIIFLFDFAEIQRKTGGKDIDIAQKILMVLFRTPHLLEHVLPFLCFLAALFVFWRFNRTKELVIFRAAGLSLWRVILPLSVISICIGCIDLAAFNPFASAFHTRYEQLQRKLLLNTQEDVKIASTGIWLSEKRGRNQAIYRADHFDGKTLTLGNITLITTSGNHKFLERIDAKEAQICKNHLIFRKGWYTLAGHPVRSFSTIVLPTSLNREHISQMNNTQRGISFWKLQPCIALLKASGLRTLKYEMMWHAFIANIGWYAAMILLAAAFGCNPERRKTPFIMVAIGLCLGFALYVFKNIMFEMGASGSLPLIVAAWLPVCLTTMVGAMLVFIQEDG